ncbi:MAG: hypothetical protein U1E79_06150 [Ottowia sp.]
MPSRIGQLQRLRPPPGLVAGAIDTLSPDLLRQPRAGRPSTTAGTSGC